MFFIFLICTAASGACAAVAWQVSEDAEMTVERQRTAIAAVGIGIAIAVLMYQIAAFSIEFYSSTDLDFWDYGQITTQGVACVGMKVCGVIGVIENILAAAAIFVKQIKQAVKGE